MARRLLHLDTDFAGDPDDACALAFLLGREDVEISAVTTTADPDGMRAGYARQVLSLAGRVDVPVVAGAGWSLTSGGAMGHLPDHDRYWGTPVAPLPAPAGAACASLLSSLQRGATLVAIGPWTNLAMLAREHPRALEGAPVVAMGGWWQPPPAGTPEWGAARDWNVQCDPDAAAEVFQRADLTLVPITTTVLVHLRAAHLPRLEAAGALGRLLARQAVAYADDLDRGTLASEHPALPDDLLNFHHDPLACGVAVGWDGVAVERLRLRPVREGDVLRFTEAPDGRLIRAAVDVDGDAFAEAWLASVERLA